MLEDKDQYARVVNGKVVEYPVSGLHIKNRKHPEDWYTRCLIEPQPSVTEVQYVKSTATVEARFVRVTHEVIDYSLHNLLRKYSVEDTMTLTTTPPDIATLSPLVVSAIADLATVEVQAKLDEFVQAKGYDNVQSAATYLNSSVTAYAADAATVISLRDQTWSALFTYLTDVQAGTTPVPTKVSDILAVLPVLAW